jgi:DinB superfamily
MKAAEPVGQSETHSCFVRHQGIPGSKLSRLFGGRNTMNDEVVMEAPQNPAGPFMPEDDYGPERRSELIGVIADAPAALCKLVDGLLDEQLDVPYRNWTIRQIVHHLADSHVNSYVRFKWTLTEDRPTIKAYDEGRWAALQDARTGDVRAPLALLEGLHMRWVQLLRSMTGQQFAHSFIHPETGNTMSLNAALCYYAWHSRHHTAQIAWVCQREGWMR